MSFLLAIALLFQPAPSDRFAIIVTGDGGWRRIDARIADRLREDGIPVASLLSNEYFAQRRTPEEASKKLESLIRENQTRWNKQRVILIGYSRGADVLPFMISRLPEDLRASIDTIALLGLEPAIDFKYHASWIPFRHPNEPQFPVQPELEKLREHHIVCIYGTREKDSLCPALDPSLARAIPFAGGHHFGGRYREIAEAILRYGR